MVIEKFGCTEQDHKIFYGGVKTLGEKAIEGRSEDKNS